MVRENIDERKQNEKTKKKKKGARSGRNRVKKEKSTFDMN